MNDQSIIVKLGGCVTQQPDTLRDLARDIETVQRGGRRAVAVVHGGGSDVTAVSRRLGMEPRFTDGVRMTSAAEMEVVDMVLCGLVNKRIVRALSAAGLDAVGISGADGGLLLGAPVSGPDGPSRTARVGGVQPALIHDLWRHGYLPVIASPGTDGAGAAVNINADEAAFAIGAAIGAGAIVFLSDVAGVIVDGAPASALDVAEAERLIAAGVITGGMVAKLRSIASAITAGVQQIVIGSFVAPGDLRRLVSGELGTTIHGVRA